jgi:hypothetical protein
MGEPVKLPPAVIHRVADAPACWGLEFVDDETLAYLDQEEGLRFLTPRNGTMSKGHDLASTSVFTNAERTRFLVARGLIDVSGKLQTEAALPKDHECLGLSADGSMVATVQKVLSLCVYRLGAGKPILVDDTGDEIDSAAFSPDGLRVVAARSGKPLRVYQLPSGRCEVMKDTRQEGHPRNVCFSPDGKWLADLAKRKRALTIRSTDTWKPVGEVKLTVGIDAVAWVRGTPWLALAADSTFVVVDTRTWKVRAEAKWARSAFEEVAASPSGRYVATVGEKAGLMVWDVAAFVGDAPRSGPAKANAKAKANEKAKPEARARPAAKVRGVFFAVPARVGLPRLLSAARNLHSILDNRPEEFALVAESDDAASGMRWFTFLGSRGRTYQLAPWIECLQLDLGPLDVALVDDANRVCLYEHYGTGPLTPDFSAISHRALVATNHGTITVSFPQKELTKKELLRAKDYATAVDIGVRQHHPKAIPTDRFRTLRTDGLFGLVVHQRKAVSAPTLARVLADCPLVGRVDPTPPLDRWPKTLPCDYRRFS